MKKIILTLLILTSARFDIAQSAEKIEFNKESSNVKIDKNDLTYKLSLEKGRPI
jgi:hypothetical protein